MIKVNLGCGKDYRTGWINVDFNPNVRADIYADFNNDLPFKNDEVDYILLDGVLEHITPERYLRFIEELHRVCKSGAIIDIYVPHYSGMHAFKHPTHYKYFGIGSFDVFRPEELWNGERYSQVRFNLIKEELFFFHKALVNVKFLSKLPINWFFNFSRKWQLIMEKFHLWGFDEIHYQLSVVKEEHENIRLL